MLYLHWETSVINPPLHVHVTIILCEPKLVLVRARSSCSRNFSILVPTNYFDISFKLKCFLYAKDYGKMNTCHHPSIATVNWGCFCANKPWKRCYFDYDTTKEKRLTKRGKDIPCRRRILTCIHQYYSMTSETQYQEQHLQKWMEIHRLNQLLLNQSKKNKF